MIEFFHVVNLRQELENTVSRQTKQVSTVNQVQDFEDLCIVGEEVDGTLIYCWTALSSANETSLKVTHIGCFDRKTKQQKTLLAFDRKTKIVNATLSTGNAFLGFVTWDVEPSSNKGIFSAYIAEVQMQNRIFSLSLERTSHIFLQFINPTQSELKEPVGRCRKLHLLVCLHLETVGVYHLPLSQAGNGMIVGDEPQKEHLPFCTQVMWAQWDIVSRRLYVVRPRRSISFDGSQIYLPNFISYQFFLDGTHNKLFETILDLPVSLGPSTKNRCNYIDVFPCKHIPVSDLHFQVLQHNNGSFCICYQENFDPPNDKSSQPPTTFQYFVIMLHWSKVLSCTVHRPIPSGSRVTFAWLGEYLVVHLDGCFTHLLNVSVFSEPYHHIFWQDPSSELPQTVRHFVPVSASIPHSGLEVYQSRISNISKVRLDESVLIDLFCEADMRTKMAVMRYAISRSSDGMKMLKLLFEEVKKSLSYSDMCLLFQDFLVGFAFAKMRHKIDGDLLQCIPCSVMDTPDTMIVFSQSRKVKLAAITYHQCKNNPKLFCDYVKSPSDCRNHICWMRNSVGLNSFKRFDLFSTAKLLTPHKGTGFQKVSSGVSANGSSSNGDSGKEENLLTSPKLTDESSSLVPSLIRNNQTGTPIHRPRSQTEIVLGYPPAFLGTSADLNVGNVENSSSVNECIDLLARHLKECSPLQAERKLANIAKEYGTCQLRSSWYLCYMLWGICITEDQPEFPSLTTAPTSQELHLVRLLSACRQTLHQLSFPLPGNFMHYFSCLVFRCKNLLIFMQHVDHQIVPVDLKFCLKILSDLDDNEENVNLKLYLLGKLDENDRIACLMNWKHPIARKLLVQQYVEHVLQEVPKVPGKKWLRERNVMTDNDDSRSFKPVVSFHKYLEIIDPGLKIGENFGVDSEFILQAFHSLD